MPDPPRPIGLVTGTGLYALTGLEDARTELRGESLRILAALAEAGPVDRAPGVVSTRAGEPLRVATGDGWLVPQRVQRAGGTALEIEAFLRGRPISDGEKLAAR